MSTIAKYRPTPHPVKAWRFKRIFLVHGELAQSEVLQKALVAEGYDAVIPEKGQSFDL